MPKINLNQNNFTSGELSPHLYMRTDLQQYRNGCKEVLNMLPIVEGGIKRRGGTQALTALNGVLRLIPFILSHTESYILAFKAYSILVLDKSGTIIRTIESPYTTLDVKEITYIQDKYSLYIAHGSHQLRWLRVSEDLTNWALSIFTYTVPPLDEIDTPTVAIKSTETAVGKITTISASAYEEYRADKQYLEDDICYAWDNGSRQYYKAIQSVIGKYPHKTAGSEAYWQWVAQDAVNTFTQADVGKYLFINEGIVRIDSFVATDTVKGEILLKLKSDIEAIARSWSFKSATFTAMNGFPKTVTLYQQRLVLGGTKKYPNYIWISRVGDTTHFLPTTTDGDSFTVSANSDQLSNIVHFAQSRGIVVLTGGSELSITATNALTPTNANITEHTTYGTVENIRPIKVGSELLFVMKGKNRLRSLVYDYSADGLVSNELSVLASHIAKEHGSFVELGYQQEPDSVIWMVLGDGTLATLTLSREQSVTAWGRHDLGGQVKSLVTLPSAQGSDLVFFLIQRGTQIFLEQLNPDYYADGTVTVAAQHVNGVCTVEHAHVGIHGSATVAYFKSGKTIYSLPIINRVGNKLTIDCDSTVGTVFVGKRSLSKISLFPPELQNSPATTSPSLFKINHINLYMYETINPKVNGSIVETKQFNQNLFDPPSPYTGHKRIELNGWTSFDEYKLEISQNEPLPFHITSLVTELIFNER